MKWSYGVTTVPKRRDDLLPRTLTSLRASGFDFPRLFVDGDADGSSWVREFGLDVTARGGPPARTAGNWLAAAVELLARAPDADRYAIFQDDVLVSRGLRAYLEQTPYPTDGYLNLYTFPQNTPKGLRDRHQYYKGMPDPPPDDYVGFYPSNQKGKGAVALVFDRDALLALLGGPHLTRRFVTRRAERLAARAGKYPADHEHRAIDGGILESMRQAGRREYVHNPSLAYHAGHQSTMGNSRGGRSVFPPTPTFCGEDFDLVGLLPREEPIALVNAPPPGGPGSELKNLLKELGLGERLGCSCTARAEHMDRLGASGVRQHREEILVWLREEAGRRGWREKLAAGVTAARAGLLLNPLDAAPGLLDEALRRAAARPA